MSIYICLGRIQGPLKGKGPRNRHKEWYNLPGVSDGDRLYA